MVNGCLLYGVELTAKQFLKIVIDEHKRNEIEWCDDDDENNEEITFDNLESFYENLPNSKRDYMKILRDYLESEGVEDYENLSCDLAYNLLEILSKRLLSEICKFTWNGACCSINKEKQLFLGWRSEGAWSNGLGSRKIKMLTTEQKEGIKEIISEYSTKKPRFYIAAQDCDFCT